MPWLLSEIVMCECGRPALLGKPACRDCSEDGLRRKWRDETHEWQTLHEPLLLESVGRHVVRRRKLRRDEQDGEES